LAATDGHGEHLGAVVDANDRALSPHPLQQFDRIEPGPAANVQEPLAGRGAEGIPDQLPSAQHIAGAVDGFELPRHVLVEHQLAHGLLQP
jgi:hypothetical protein